MIDFTIVPDGGEKFEVKATTRDILNWEKTTRGASMKQLMEDMRLVELYKVAHFAAKRTQQFSGDLKEFQETCDLEFAVEEESNSDPT